MPDSSKNIKPNAKLTGDACRYGQSRPVFVAPGQLYREVRGSHLRRAGGNGALVSAVELPPFLGRNDAKPRECAATATYGIVEIPASVDGESIASLAPCRASGPLVSLTFSGNDIVDV